MLKGLCCKKVFIPDLSALSCANPVISRVELICLELRDPDMWNQVLDNALREPASRWESEESRGSSGDAVKDEGRVLHHLCWADDLYAMAGTMNHLTGILEDMTNAIERLGMRWKEKSLAYHCCWAIHGVQTWRSC